MAQALLFILRVGSSYHVFDGPLEVRVHKGNRITRWIGARLPPSFVGVQNERRCIQWWCAHRVNILLRCAFPPGVGGGRGANRDALSLGPVCLSSNN